MSVLYSLFPTWEFRYLSLSMQQGNPPTSELEGPFEIFQPLISQLEKEAQSVEGAVLGHMASQSRVGTRA